MTTPAESRPGPRAEISGAAGLPLAVRLKRAVLIALLLGAWAPFKIMWERQIAAEQDQLRYHGIVITRQLRDELGQGFSLGVLSGMGSVVADLLWIVNVTLIWENQEWFKIASYINLCTTLQPRSITFWDGGGWQLAWNASVGAMQDVQDRDPLRRLKASRYWIERGLDVYLRGIENNPESWVLRAHTGLLYQQRLQDYAKAAEYYQQASELPDAPVFYERFPAIMYQNGGDDRAAYEAWRALWLRLTPAQRAQPVHEGDRIEKEIRRLEAKLAIPPEKRIFPN
jgi:tetratricopeptide (TPR) repeat protein